MTKPSGKVERIKAMYIIMHDGQDGPLVSIDTRKSVADSSGCAAGKTKDLLHRKIYAGEDCPMKGGGKVEKEARHG